MTVRDELIKGTILGDEARFAVVRTTDAVNTSIKLHAMSPLAAAALGRALTAGAYLGASLTEVGQRFNLIIDGGGPIGKICVAGEYGGKIRGFAENPKVDLPRVNGKWDVGGAVGKEGFLTVVKDLGLKEPYTGKCRLVSGEIAEDFAAYLRYSEGIPNATVLGVLTDRDGCKGAGGVFLEALPGASENTLVVLEDLADVLKSVSAIFAQKDARETADFYFAHLDAKIFPPVPVRLHCDCAHKIRRMLHGLGEAECRSILAEQGVIEVNCDYCSAKYHFTEREIDEMFGGKK